MDIKLNIKYTLELNRDEWIVVSKALRVYAASPVESPGDERERGFREVATRLQEQMVQQKANVLDQMAQEANVAAENVAAAKLQAAQTALQPKQRKPAP
jgi:hypothetical protein